MCLSNYASISEHSGLMELMLILTSIYTRTPNNTIYDEDRVILVAISQISGMASFIVWLFVQIPQLIENHLNRSVHGLSLLFIILWGSGDLSNCVGILLSGTPFQIFIGVYHCFMGLALGVQYWYYAKIYPRITERKSINLEDLPNIYESELNGRVNRFQKREQKENSRLHNLHTPRSGQFVNGFLKTTLNSSAFIQSSHASPIVSKNKVNKLQSKPLARKKFNEISSAILLALSSSLGQVISLERNSTPAWMCSLFYIFSRPPQIIQNYKRKSINGLSLYTFLLAMIGNSLFTISIVSSSCILFKKDIDAFTDMMSLTMPYVICSVVTFFFDTILLIQCFYYDDSNLSINSINPNFLSDNLIFREYNDYNYDNNNNNNYITHPNYRHLRTGKGKQKKKPIYDDESSSHFQTPAWYANNHLINYTNEDREDSGDSFFKTDSRKPPRDLPSQNETTSLLNNAINYTLTTPPSHYISRSVIDKQSRHSLQQAVPNSFANSTSRNEIFNAVKSAVSISSLNSVIFKGNGTNSHINTSALNTSLIPSIVSNYSSISKKLSHDSKTPFLPSDFLSDDFYNRSEHASIPSNNMQ